MEVTVKYTWCTWSHCGDRKETTIILTYKLTKFSMKRKKQNLNNLLPKKDGSNLPLLVFFFFFFCLIHHFQMLTCVPITTDRGIIYPASRRLARPMCSSTGSSCGTSKRTGKHNLQDCLTYEEHGKTDVLNVYISPRKTIRGCAQNSNWPLITSEVYKSIATR